MMRRLVSWSVLLLAACATKPVDQIIHAWLGCDECVGGELERLKARGNAAVVPLVEALITGPGPDQIDNVRAQAVADRAAAERFRSRNPGVVSAAAAASPVDSASYVGTYVRGYVEGYRRRALQGLAAINTPTAIDSIKAVWAGDSVTPIPDWSPAMHQLARAYSHGVTDLDLAAIPTVSLGQTYQAVAWVTARPGTASDLTWAIEDPTRATVSSNGMVTAVAAGTTRLTVCVDGLPGICSSAPVRVQ